MKPLNEKEMNSSFLEFALFFLVTVLVVYFAYYPNTQLSKAISADIKNVPSDDKIINLSDSIKSQLLQYKICTVDKEALLQGKLGTEIANFGILSDKANSAEIKDLYSNYNNDYLNITDYLIYEKRVAALKSDSINQRQNYDILHNEYLQCQNK